VITTNWAGNVAFSAATLLRPTSADELRAMVAGHRKVRVLGAGHSFSPIADSPDAIVTLDGVPREVNLDSANATVRVSGAVRYAELAAELDRSGFALANLASLPHITVAGATATGTHGSGDRNGTLSASIAGIDLVIADGDPFTVPAEEMAAAAVGLGAFGVVTALTLKVVPAFTVRQHVYDNLPRTELEAGFGEIFASAYSVSAFTTWRDPAIIDMLWLKHRADDGWSAPDTWHGARLADGPRHPIPGMPTEYTTTQEGAEGPWHERLPHFRAEFTPSTGDEIQTEYLLPREHATGALEALSGLAPRIAPLLLINEIRTVAADDLWLSPASGRDTVAFHFTWRKDPVAVSGLLPAIEDRLAPFTPRPHWGKVFTLAPTKVRAAYPGMKAFERLVSAYDPAGKFRNEFLSAILEV
jgi:alditol oxidase